MADSSKSNERQDKQLHELIKAAREVLPKDDTRPSSDAIEAYLLGSATSNQELEVRDALIRSAEFRRELLTMAADIDSLTEANVAAEFERAATQDMPLPSLRSFLASAGSGDTIEESRRSGLVGLIVPEGLTKLLHRAFAPGRKIHGKWITASSLAVSAVLVALIVRIGYISRYAETEQPVSQISGWALVSQMDVEMFEYNITRTPNGDDDIVDRHASHADAAKAEFMRLVRYENGNYTFDATSATVSSDHVPKSLVIRLVTESGTILEEVAMTIPATQDTVSSAQLWALAIPSRALRSLPIVSDTVSAVWDPDADPICCTTVTYGVNGKFVATSAVVIEF